ncbi:hypothetical protein F5B19DRAFT_495324 [Rostrohypoxylon terebratum]|nr:hypothetical protein F5B19DRAFT_495324 [Rostrohypoxylon terebratum]
MSNFDDRKSRSPRLEMGNVLGKPQVLHITYDSKSPSSDSSSIQPYYYDSDNDYEYEYLDNKEFCDYYNSYDYYDRCPWCGLIPADQVYEVPDWEDAVVGVVRRKGCTNRDHWALAFRSDIDVSQLPRRINGYRTRIPSRCKNMCSYWQPVYIFAEQESSDSGSSLEVEAAGSVTTD